MGEYTQLTLTDWMNMKGQLQAELLGIKKGFVKVGYWLRRIEESEGYKQDGYDTLAEWAKAEYNLEASTVSRFKAINAAYSENGFSEHLLPEYEAFNRSQLEEMLSLPEPDRAMVSPDMKRADIREIKAFNKAEPAAGIADDEHELIRIFFTENHEILKEVYKNLENEDAMREAVIPSGARAYRKGKMLVSMTDAAVSIKKTGENPVKHTWEEFFRWVLDIYGEELEEDEQTEETPEEPAEVEAALPDEETQESNAEPEKTEPDEGSGEDGKSQEEHEKPERPDVVVGDQGNAEKSDDREDPESAGEHNTGGPEDSGSGAGTIAGNDEHNERICGTDREHNAGTEGVYGKSATGGDTEAIQEHEPEETGENPEPEEHAEDEGSEPENIPPESIVPAQNHEEPEEKTEVLTGEVIGMNPPEKAEYNRETKTMDERMKYLIEELEGARVMRRWSYMKMVALLIHGLADEEERKA